MLICPDIVKHRRGSGVASGLEAQAVETRGVATKDGR